MASAAPNPPSPSAAVAPLRLERGLIAGALIDEATQTLKAMMGGGEGDDLDGCVDRLVTEDRARLSAVYDAFRETMIFRRIVTDPALAAVAREMTGAQRLHSPFQHCVFRMDLAGEHWRGFGWHQDHPYNMLSERSVTAWLPLTPTGPHNGSVQIASARSDRLHPVDVRFKRDADGAPRATRDAFIAATLQPGFDAFAETVTLDPGDVVLFGNRLVHRSGFNPGPRHRYSIQARFGDLLAPEMIARGWANRRTDGFDTFKTLHPHLVDDEESR
jgi:hypothetical protein